MIHSPDQNRKLALLLSNLSPELTDAATSRLSDGQAKSVKQQLESMGQSSPDQDEVNRVLDEFTVFMKFALKTAGAASDWSDELFTEDPESDESHSTEQTNGKPKLKLFEPTDDPIHDLEQLDPSQIAIALESEQPKTIAILLSNVASEIAANVINQFPRDLQPKVFFALQEKPIVPHELMIRLAKKTVERAAPIEPNNVESTNADQQTVNLLRALPKASRLRLMQEFEANDPTTAQRVRDMLYTFEDIVQYDNRSIQKILGQCETPTLVIALQGIEDDIANRVFENLSKRAEMALREELEFQPPNSPDEISAAQNDIAKLISKLDGEGELVEQP